ncbi:hypothetical protein TrST_g11609 [Triparma strigata]|nr:hypothetical protein TrST_g11609 [Triparma strigata]
MTSEDRSNAIEVLDLNNLDVGHDEEEVVEGSELDSAAVETPAVGGDNFMHTDDFRRLFVGIVMADTLVGMRWLDRKWHAVVEKKLIELEDEPFGEIIVHGGNDISGCTSLREMKVPDSLQTFVTLAFGHCSKLVPSDINVNYDTEAVVAYLRSIQ